jgi:hypothetical protein
MNNDPSLCNLDVNHVVGFDESQWAYLLIADGPRLNFRPESVLRLRTFLNDPTQHNSRISESYRAEQSCAEGMILRVNTYAYSFSAEATQRLRDFLNQVTGARGGDPHEES